MKDLWLNGKYISVTDEVYEVYTKGNRKNKYFTDDLKKEKIIVNQEKEKVRFIPSREDSYERLTCECEKEFADLTECTEDEARADGQVIKISFYDGVYFEILPAFKNIDWYGNWDGTYKYPDTNMGGNWRSTNPKAEQEAMKIKNNTSNGLLFDTCKHLRHVRDNYFSSYHLSGIVIDSFVYHAIGDWQWSPPGSSSSAESGTFEKVLLDYFVNNISWGQTSISAPGSNQSVSLSSSIECLNKVLKYISH